MNEVVNEKPRTFDKNMQNAHECLRQAAEQCKSPEAVKRIERIMAEIVNIRCDMVN